MCYNVLQKKWLEWSEGYMLPIEKTTLRGVKVFAAIAGKDLTEPAKQNDAIWHFVFKVRGKSKEHKFKAEQLQLAVVIDYEDFERVEEMKDVNEGYEVANTGNTRRGTDILSPRKVSEYNPGLFITH